MLSLGALEGASPDPTNLFSSTFQVNTYCAKRAYRKHLKLTTAAESESVLLGWDMDEHDRVYKADNFQFTADSVGLLRNTLGRICDSAGHLPNLNS